MVDAIYYCGVTDSDLFNFHTKTDRVAAELFCDDLLSCMYKTYKESDEDLKLYFNLLVVNEKISLGTGQKKNIKAFI